MIYNIQLSSNPKKYKGEPWGNCKIIFKTKYKKIEYYNYIK